MHKSFHTPHGVVTAVNGVDLAIGPSETVALLGPNGAGKSTTIEMMLGLTRPDRGSVALLGDPPERAIARGALGAMLQVGALIRDVTARELLTMAGSLYPRALAVGQVLEWTGLEEVADRRTHKLSGGQSQRLRFALAIIPDPAVLVLDEPTVGMDVEGRRSFWGAVRAFAARGRTVLFATHYLEEADAYADRVVLLARGRVVADGPTSEVRARVAARIIRATLPAEAGGTGALSSLPGVVSAERHGDAVSLMCSDSDAAIRALLRVHPEARDIEIAGAGLEQAFIELTADAPPAGTGREREDVPA